jgi:hypothetical protein
MSSACARRSPSGTGLGSLRLDAHAEREGAFHLLWVVRLLTCGYSLKESTFALVKGF